VTKPIIDNIIFRRSEYGWLVTWTQDGSLRYKEVQYKWDLDNLTSHLFEEADV